MRELAPGQTFHIPSGPKGSHLFIIALGPVKLPNYGKQPQVITAAITSVRENVPHDPTCIIDPGEHPFIKHTSYIAYRHMRIDPASHIQTMLAGTWTPCEDCSSALLERIIRGVTISCQTAQEFTRIFSGFPHRNA
jgi:hypothetical protein